MSKKKTYRRAADFAIARREPIYTDCCSWQSDRRLPGGVHVQRPPQSLRGGVRGGGTLISVVGSILVQLHTAVQPP